MNSVLQDLTMLFNALNQPYLIGILLVIGYVILPRLKFLNRFFPNRNLNGLDETKSALMRLAVGMEKISGNDLSHLKEDIDRIGISVDAFHNEFQRHDKQAGEILTRVEDCWDKIKNL